MSNIKIHQLFTYPIKSAGGIEVERVLVKKTGFEHDRSYAIIDANNKIITARENPKLLKISTIVSDSKLLLSFGNKGPIQIDLAQKATPKIDIQIFEDFTTATLIDSKIDNWLETILKQKCKLISLDNENMRSVKPKYTNKKNTFLSFADVAPIHLISKESVDYLNNKLSIPVSTNRFRSNIVISGCEAFEEENWNNLKIGTCEFEVITKTERCSLITTDPSTTEKDPNQEPLRTLAKFKKDANTVIFGVYLIPKTTGIINLSDNIEIETIN